MKNNLGNKAIMAKNIQRYMEQQGRDRNDISKAIDVPYTTVTDWINAVTYPRIDSIEKMARYFNITKADLVEEDAQPLRDEQIKLALFGGDTEVTDEMWEEAKLAVELIKDRAKRKKG